MLIGSRIVPLPCHSFRLNPFRSLALTGMSYIQDWLDLGTATLDTRGTELFAYSRRHPARNNDRAC